MEHSDVFDCLYSLEITNLLDNKIKWKEAIESKKTSYLKANGAVFICDIKQFKKEKELYIDGMLGYEMKPEESIDVDTELDFILATALMRLKDIKEWRV